MDAVWLVKPPTTATYNEPNLIGFINYYRLLALVFERWENIIECGLETKELENMNVYLQQLQNIKYTTIQQKVGKIHNLNIAVTVVQ